MKKILNQKLDGKTLVSVKEFLVGKLASILHGCYKSKVPIFVTHIKLIQSTWNF